jgi:hypothetical protein
MRRDFVAFAIIALASELGTSWLVRYRSLSPGASLVCFSDLQTMVADRLWIWAVLFFLSSAVWLLLSKGRRSA